MRRYIVPGIVIVVVIAGLLGWLNRDALTYQVMRKLMAPAASFAASPVPTAPDYSSMDSWAAHPDRQSLADFVPQGASAARSATAPGQPTAAFFIHPTTYLGGQYWNQPMGDPQAEWIIRERTLRHQASVFNACCTVYAPHYRQATIFAFVDRSGDGLKALDLAYQDVRRAFDQFLRQIPPGSPFIVAGHSQGAHHGDRLVREVVAPGALRKRLVSAYLIGFSVAASPLRAAGVPVCTAAGQVGCVVGWNAVETGGRGLFDDSDDVICVNPLNWRADPTAAPAQANLGSIGFPQYQGPVGGEQLGAVRVVPAVADGTCRNGRLEVSEIHSTEFPARMPGTPASLHPYDYGLFYANLRRNAKRRVTAFGAGPP